MESSKRFKDASFDLDLIELKIFTKAKYNY